MGARIETAKGFVDHYIEFSIDPDSFLSKVSRLVDWRPFELHLAKWLKRGPAAAGQPPYPDLVMLKAIILQFMYNLSDDGLSQALKDRISFIHFIDLPFTSSKPDGSTIGRFRNSLLKNNRYRKLLSLFNQQLEDCGLLVKTGVAVDATLIPSCRHPRKKVDLETVPHDRKEDQQCNSSDQGDSVKQDAEDNSTITACNGHPQETVDSERVVNDSKEGDKVGNSDKSEPVKGKVSYSDDHDATWTKKKDLLVYGFKINGIVDLIHGFILGGHATGANISDITEFCRVVAECYLPKGSVVQGDKGYASKFNRMFLHESGLRDGIMCKGTKNRKIGSEEKMWNSFISKTRWMVERTFGTLKKVQGFVRARYRGTDKVEMEYYLQALAHNIKKAVNLSA